MKLRMAENSLFGILLRSAWWISAGLALAIVVIARVLLPAEYFAFGAFAAIPFAGIACVRLWKLTSVPSASRVARTLERVNALSWPEFARLLEDAFQRDGHVVKRLSGAEADFELLKVGRISLVSGRRWKVARTGVEPLRNLVADQEKRDAHDCIYVVAGELTDNARKYAAEKRIRLMQGAELTQLLRGVALPRQRSS